MNACARIEAIPLRQQRNITVGCKAVVAINPRSLIDVSMHIGSGAVRNIFSKITRAASQSTPTLDYYRKALEQGIEKVCEGCGVWPRKYASEYCGEVSCNKKGFPIS